MSPAALPQTLALAAVLGTWSFCVQGIALQSRNVEDPLKKPPEESGIMLDKMPTDACSMQGSWDHHYIQEVLQSVGSGNYSMDVEQAWLGYQDKLADTLRSKYPQKAPPAHPFRILVVTAVHDSAKAVEDFERNLKTLRSNKAGDVFEWAFFHHDGSSAEWERSRWYKDRRGPVVMKHTGQGCKPQFWQMITPQMAEKYDFVWLLDEDIRLDFLNWDFYRTVLYTMEPLVSQPVIIPREPRKRSTGVTRLRMVVPTGSQFPIAYETQRSEVQAPILSAKVWPAVIERNAGHDRTNDWFIDDFWDSIALISSIKCHKTAVLAVNAAPARHMDCHNLFRNKAAKCTEGCGPEKENCHPITEAEEASVRKALEQTGCDLPVSWARDACEGLPVHDCHSRLYARAPRRQVNQALNQ